MHATKHQTGVAARMEKKWGKSTTNQVIVKSSNCKWAIGFISWGAMIKTLVIKRDGHPPSAAYFDDHSQDTMF